MSPPYNYASVIKDSPAALVMLNEGGEEERKEGGRPAREMRRKGSYKCWKGEKETRRMTGKVKQNGGENEEERRHGK